LVLNAQACKSDAARLPGQEKVLARVNDSEISAYELQASLERSFGPERAAAADQRLRRQVLESLVLSRAVALAREAELDLVAKAELERKVAVYREELLVKQYLAKHQPPTPVSNEQAERFYREHPERFGGGQTKRYELIGSERELASGERETLLRALEGGAERADWSAWVKELRAKGMPLVFVTGRGNEGALQSKLRGLIAALAPGQASPVTFVEGRAYLVRVVASESIAPTPFDQVKPQIKELLTPIQVKESLQKARTTVMRRTRVQYSK
jgi:hypothetical protein